MMLKYWSPKDSYCLVVELFYVKYILTFITLTWAHAKFLQQQIISEAYTVAIIDLS